MRDTDKVDKKIKRKRNAFILIIFLLLIGVFFILYTRTSFFHVSQIIINSNDFIEDEKIIMASGIISGENIFKINIKNAKENLLFHPYIKDAVIKRKMPNKIIIDITERKQVLLINFIGSYLYIDNEGKILNILSENTDENLPVVYGLNIKNPQIGENVIYVDEEISVDIQNFFDIFIESKLVENVSTIEFIDNSKVNFELKNGTKVAFGTMDNVKYKVSFLLAIIENMNKNNENYESIYLDKGSNAIIKRNNN